MRKTLLIAIALASSLFTTPVSALEKETSEGNNIANQKIQNLYPKFKGYNVVAFIKNRDGRPVVQVQFNTDDDLFADVRYTYEIIGRVGEIFSLTYPSYVEIDEDENHLFDEYEITYLNGRTSEELKPKKPTESSQLNPYPDLRGDNLVSLAFAKRQNGLTIFMHYYSKSKNPADIIYSHLGIFKEERLFLKSPHKVFLDLDGDGVAERDEVFNLREEPEKKGWNI